MSVLARVRDRVVLGASVTALAGVFGYAFTSRTSRAELIDPTVATSFGVGPGPTWATERGSGARTARVAALPSNPSLVWARGLGGRIDWPAVSDEQGNVIVAISPSGGGVSEGQLVELAAQTGVPRATVKLRTPVAASDPSLEGLAPLQADSAASAPIVLANGTRVVVTIRGFALGVAPGGSIVFRTRLGGEIASVPRVGLAPLPSGGFAVTRRPELVELDAHGTIVDRVRVDTGPYLAVRDSGEVVAVTAQGDLVTWRAHRLVRTLGSFGSTISSDGPCRGGVVIDGTSNAAPGARRERAICASETLVEQMDLATGARRALIGKLPLPFRTTTAVGSKGDLALVIAGGSLLGVGALGNDLGPFDIPGAAPVLGPKDGGVVYVPAVGEVPPIVADDGAIAWGSGDGVAIVRAGVVQKVTRCGGMFATSLAGIGAAGPRSLLVTCIDGKVELFADK